MIFVIEVSFRFKVSNDIASEDKVVNVVITEKMESLLTLGINNKTEVLNQILDIKINDKTIKEWVSQEIKDSSE